MTDKFTHGVEGARAESEIGRAELVKSQRVFSSREEVPTDKRRAMTPARKLRIWNAWEGKCWFCRMPVDQEGPGVVYDHIPTLWISGSDADRDIGPIHAAPCNKIKTAADQSRIAKTKRQKAKHEGTYPASKSKIRSRGFERGARGDFR